MTDTATPANDTKSATRTGPKIREAIGQGVETARETATDAVKAVRATANDTARLAASSIEGNPLAVLVGGIAVGVLAGTLLPKTDRESELLGPVGKKLTDGAAAAARAARDAGKAELISAGISSDAARQQVGKLFESVVSAARTAGDAAIKTAKPEK